MAQDAEAAASADDTASADGTAARSSVESWLQPGDALEDWTQEPFEEPDLVAETEPEREPEPEPVRSPAAQTPSRRPRASSLHDWIAAPLPSAASSLDDWVQGPIEQQVELNAEDAWSTADSVSGTWQPARPETQEGTEPGPVPEPARRSRPAFRGELHGLRALALVLVAVYHIWLGRVSGGVDVFLFLSAFFLTGTFVRRLESGQPLGVPRYWLHVFKRLLPPAAVTILLTLVATAALLPSSLWPTVMREAAASITYVQNALLVLTQVDYHARDAGAASPLQHFWSLSVQGQVFVLWPLLFALLVPRARHGKAVRRPLIVIMLVIGAASLTWSVLSTQTQQQIAYFDTAARLWEFAAGSLLALTLPLLDRVTGARRPEEGRAPRLRTPRALLGWTGIIALLACGIVLDVSLQFPGWIALWPLVAAGAVVVAGHSGRVWGVDRLLSTRPAAFIGDISYALYLVHWPILVIWLHTSSQERAGLWDGLAVLTASMVLAWALTRAVDAPVRRSEWLEARPWRALTAVAASVAVVVAASGGWWLALPGSEARTPVASTEPVVPTDEVATEAPLTVRPQGWQLGTQWPNLPESCEGPWAPSSSFHNITCQQLLPGDATASETIVVLGSSHSRQYIPALIPLARERGAQIVNLSMDGCEFVIREDDSGYCGGYDRYALSYLDQVEPDAVLMTATLTSPDSPEEVMPAGTEEAVGELLARGIDVIATRDNPRWQEDPFECAEAVIDDEGTPAEADEACGADLEDKHAAQNPAAPLADLAPSDGRGDAQVTVVDLSARICPDDRCPPVLGDTYVYMDDNHMTRLFVEQTLTAPMTRELEAAGF